ncbi:protein Hook homolog 1 [Bombus terrestris]|uniref:Protein Hook homolog 1 n=1 Tax=Bombus terrestris TaxID=30195 RepID=A0A9B2MR19_BOMTE|nr:protein Hook homolog 1 [Bombus terrestris]
MEEQEYIGCELQGILEEFTRIRDAYLALKAYCEMQEEATSIEKARSERLQMNLEKLSTTYLLLENRYKSIVEKLQTERDDLRKTNEELKEQCDHLRLINAEDRGGNNNQICKLQDELEVLKAQLVMQEEKHNENVALLKQQHFDELQRYRMLLQNGKQASTSRESKKRERTKNLGKNRKKVSFFRWPELDIETINSVPLEARNDNEAGNRNCATKKRKLFHEDRDIIIDIP